MVQKVYDWQLLQGLLQTSDRFRVEPNLGGGICSRRWTLASKKKRCWENLPVLSRHLLFRWEPFRHLDCPKMKIWSKGWCRRHYPVHEVEAEESWSSLESYNNQRRHQKHRISRLCSDVQVFLSNSCFWQPSKFVKHNVKHLFLYSENLWVWASSP